MYAETETEKQALERQVKLKVIHAICEAYSDAASLATIIRNSNLTKEKALPAILKTINDGIESEKFNPRWYKNLSKQQINVYVNIAYKYKSIKPGTMFLYAYRNCLLKSLRTYTPEHLVALLNRSLICQQKHTDRKEQIKCFDQLYNKYMETLASNNYLETMEIKVRTR